MDFHQESMRSSGEKIISGKSSGLIELHETVTFEAKHFGIKQKLTSKITQFNSPHHFRDEQISGAFKQWVHDHSFTENEGGTKMVDLIEYQLPFGSIGALFDRMFLHRYLTKIIKQRCNEIKHHLETIK